MRTKHLIIAGSGVALTLVLAACGSSTSSSPAASSASSMMGASAGASAVAMGSTADISFAQLMIPHHAQAIEMADLALTNATSPDVKALAQQIKDAQNPEIAMMGGWLTSWGASDTMPGMDHSGSAAGGMDMGGVTGAGMMTPEDMAKLSSAAGPDFDTMWLQMMIAHHQGAVTMAQQVLDTTQNADVAKLAQNVVDGQTTEITTMQKLLAG
jgi:uncharacterized protein (DUF305 family)